MKFKIAGILSLAALLGLFVYARAQLSAGSHSQPASLPGRYQLRTATIEKIVPKPQKVVFRVDSQTGQVWMLALHADAGGHDSFFWNSIPRNDVQPKEEHL
jgi:hypothetical protein